MLSVVGTGLIIAFADQENEFEIPCEHEYEVVAFNHGEVTFQCEICGETCTDDFVNHINQRNYTLMDMNNDGIVNGKDYAYLLREYQVQN